MNDDDLIRVRQTVKALRRLRGRDLVDGRETLLEKIKRWQHLRMPSIALEQVGHRSSWSDLFDEIRRRIADVWPSGDLIDIQHVGSSAITALPSKNVIDIALIVAHPPASELQIETLRSLGFEGFGQGPGSPDVYWFWMVGHPEAVFVVHLCQVEDPWWQSAVDFRDYLRAHPAEAERYEERKRRLADVAEQGVLAYSLGKIEQMLELTERARRWRAGRGMDGEERDRGVDRA